MSPFPKSIVGSQYFILIEIKPNIENAIPSTTFDGWMARVRVDRLTRGSNKTQFNLFFGKVDQLFAYSVKEGRKWITKQVALNKLIPHKWWNENPLSTFSKWNIIWHKAKAQKEVAFLWTIIHKVVVINKWRGKISVEINKFALIADHNWWFGVT